MKQHKAPIGIKYRQQKLQEVKIDICENKTILIDTDTQIKELRNEMRFAINFESGKDTTVLELIHEEPDYLNKNIQIITKKIESTEGEKEENKYLHYVYAIDRYACKRFDKIMGEKLPWVDLNTIPDLVIQKT